MVIPDLPTGDGQLFEGDGCTVSPVCQVYQRRFRDRPQQSQSYSTPTQLRIHFLAEVAKCFTIWYQSTLVVCLPFPFIDAQKQTQCSFFPPHVSGVGRFRHPESRAPGRELNSGMGGFLPF